MTATERDQASRRIKLTRARAATDGSVRRHLDRGRSHGRMQSRIAAHREKSSRYPAAEPGRNALSVALLPSVYLVDLLLMNRVTEYLVGMQFGKSSATESFRYGIPAAVIAFELYFASLAAEARRDYEDGFSGPWRYRILTLASLAFAFALPMGALATLRAARTSLDAAAFLMMTYMLAALAPAGHIAILWNPGLLGQLSHVAWLGGGAWYSMRLTMAEARLARSAADVEAAFRSYSQQWNEYARKYGAETFPQPPFAADAREALTRVFGYDVVEEPSRAGESTAQREAHTPAGDEMSRADPESEVSE